MKYSLVIVTHNAESDIPRLASNIAELTQQPEEIVIVDSASGDDTNKQIQTYFPQALHLPQVMNVDFCRGYNTGIAQTKEAYVLMINQRITLTPESVSHLIKKMQSDTTIAVVGPKLLQAGTTTIDTMGIVTDRRRHFSNLGQGKDDTGQYDNTPVFGVSGAAMFIRKTAFEDSAKNGGGSEHEYFDEDFIAYKDDIDIAYRLRHRGWSLVIEPRAVMSYERNARTDTRRKERSERVKVYSLCNHWWTLLKNEPFSAIVRDLLWIVLYETMKLTYLSLTDPKTVFRFLPRYFRKLPRMLKKRGAIQTSSKNSKELSQWFT